MRNLYYAQKKTFCDELKAQGSPTITVLSDYPTPAIHGAFYVVGSMPKGYDGETLDLYLAGLDETGENGLTPIQFKALVDSELSKEHTGKIIIMTKAQGKWLEKNHPAFMSAVTEE